ncbi:MAG TPA: helix-turn-helix domain-containing protein [Polyangium sp.]|nr:helix-turn-helix domain-containing protein [Polyangium sp.]
MGTSRDPAPTLELLLADASEHRPVLDQGLPENAANLAPKPDKVPRGVDGMLLDAPDADPNDLSKQRWGVIHADSEAGRKAFNAIAPLIAWRQRQQEASVKSWAVPAEMDVQSAFDWKNKVLRSEYLPEHKRPRYLLILGDLNDVSAELGHVLANGSFVGRIHFDDVEGYAAYAQKVVDWERGPAKLTSKVVEKAALDFFVARDGTKATEQGQRRLVGPCITLARRKSRKPFPADVHDPWEDVRGASDLLERCRIDRPSVFVSVCHGAGRPQGGWKKPGDERQLQGALKVGHGASADSLLTAEQLTGSEPFLPGGIWFAVACFGAGTPPKSAFYSWLRQLREAGQYNESVEQVLESLPKDEEKPFLAALPKAVLQNPNGPLAFFGHLDLAWTCAFTDMDGTSRASRIFSALSVLANGNRAGVAHGALMRAYREVNDELLAGYEVEQDGRLGAASYKPNAPRRARAFMLRNDLRGYILLGDPAARLPLAQNWPSIEAKTLPTVTIPRAPEMEQAVLAVLARVGSNREIAAKYGIRVEMLERWVEVYKAAGRAALEKMGS